MYSPHYVMFVTALVPQRALFVTALVSYALVVVHSLSHDLFSDLTRAELATYYSSYDLKRLELYSQNLIDYHLVMDLLPTLAKLYYLGQIKVNLSAVQSVRKRIFVDVQNRVLAVTLWL